MMLRDASQNGCEAPLLSVVATSQSAVNPQMTTKPAVISLTQTLPHAVRPQHGIA